MQFEYLNTDRLTLRLLTPEVYEYVFANYSDIELMDFFGFLSLDKVVEERLKHEEGLTAYAKSFVQFVLIEKATNKAIGACGFHTWFLKHQRAEIGYMIYDPDNRSKGYMKEALKAIIDYGFTKMLLHRIEALIGSENEPSLRLVKGLHFTREAILREHYNVNNVYEDSIVFSLLRKEAGYGK